MKSWKSIKFQNPKYIKLFQLFKAIQHSFYSWQRFSLRFKLILLLPFLAWILLFKGSAFISSRDRPNIDVTTLPKIENYILFGISLQKFPMTLLPCDEEWALDLVRLMDFLAALVYLLHFGVTWIFIFAIYFYFRKKSLFGYPVLQPWTFIWCFGLLNATAVMTHLGWPTAPPWYIEMYGFKTASYNITGDEAGLDRVDEMLEFPLFAKLYGSSPVVFGSFPSLHGSWPMMLGLFAPSIRLKIVCLFYTIWVWWAAMYLNHHFLVDLLGGIPYVLFSYIVGLALISSLQRLCKGWMYSKGTFKLAKLGKRDEEESDYELLKIDNDGLLFKDDLSTFEEVPSKEFSI